MVFGWFRNNIRPEASPGVDDILAEIKARSGAATRAPELPAWALMPRSPYKTYPDAVSWLGGVPQVPASFRWPTSNEGRPLHFIAQIDLATLQPEPSTGSRAPSLPEEGALLFFVGDSYAVRILSADEMKRAAPAALPGSMQDVSELGYWGMGPTFSRWPVDPIAYLSRGEGRPDFLPDPFRIPEQWITTWGLAAFEASIAHDKLAKELRQGREFMAYRRSRAAQGKPLPSKPQIEKRIVHCGLMEDHAPSLLGAMQYWQELAASQEPEGPVDGAGLSEMFAERTQLSTAMQNNYGARSVLPGDAQSVWRDILAIVPGTRSGKDFEAIAPAYRSFVETMVTDWRGHRLFGLEPEFPNNGEDLRYQNPLISIAADELIGTESEHDYGFSVWLKDEDIAQGRHTDGQFIRHCAV